MLIDAFQFRQECGLIVTKIGINLSNKTSKMVVRRKKMFVCRECLLSYFNLLYYCVKML